MAARPVTFVLVFSSLAVALGACASHTDGPGADGPNRLRPAAALNDSKTKSTPPTAPRLEIAALHQEPAATTDPAIAPEPANPATPATAACPDKMVLVEGEYCTDVKQICDDWVDNPSSSSVARCKHYKPSECTGQKVHKRFCIDKDEYTKAGDSLPEVNASWTDAKGQCEADGKRLCYESEWNFACEGPEMLPYTTGYERDSSKCNYDQKKLLDTWGKARDLRMSVAETEQCISPFGVRNMNGNVDEWTFRDVTNGEWRSAMKGGWWMAARDRCRPATTAHDEHFKGFQSGFRCCADAK
jgi:hypothetical protein